MKKQILNLVLGCAVLFSAIAGQAASVVTTQDVRISEPKFVEQLIAAYQNEMEKQPDGSLQFSSVLRCYPAKQECYLLKGKWHGQTEPSFLKGVMYTPVNDSDVFDLHEYMKLQPKVEAVGGQTMRTKEVLTSSSGKQYSLTCVTATDDSSGEISFSQCVVYNGMVE